MRKIIAEDYIDDDFKQGDVMDETDKINKYVYKYYKKLYTKVNTNEDIQNEFLDLVNNKVHEEDNEMLTEGIELD